MIKIENTVLPSGAQWKAIISSMRNPMNSWSKSDSKFNSVVTHYDEYGEFGLYHDYDIGDNDLNLMKRLCRAGTDHRKFMRMITVYADITAPLYWWKEFDTYKVGTVANSCSTMHKIHEKEFTLDDFSRDNLKDKIQTEEFECYPKCMLAAIIKLLNICREEYITTKDKSYWWQMIQLLPSSYNQKRTVMLNYEVLANIYHARKNHKLDEWYEFCDWVKTLPYAKELIIGEE